MKVDTFGAWPKTEDEMLTYVREQMAQDHDYNTCVDALTNCTVAMFNYVASVLGMTGFQASWSGLQFLRITRYLEGPFAILDGAKLLYPQYDLREQFEGYMREWPKQLAEIARKNMAEAEAKHDLVSPRVYARWAELAALAPEAAHEEGQA